MHDTRQKISIQEIFGLFKGPLGFLFDKFCLDKITKIISSVYTKCVFIQLAL